jgi:hypothetical protein
MRIITTSIAACLLSLASATAGVNAFNLSNRYDTRQVVDGVAGKSVTEIDKSYLIIEWDDESGEIMAVQQISFDLEEKTYEVIDGVGDPVFFANAAGKIEFVAGDDFGSNIFRGFFNTKKGFNVTSGKSSMEYTNLEGEPLEGEVGKFSTAAGKLGKKYADLESASESLIAGLTKKGFTLLEEPAAQP